MEVYINFDLATQTGYGLRLQRLNPADIEAIGFNGGGAVAGVACSLVKYDNGVVTHLTNKVMTSAFLTECTIQLKTQGGRLQGIVTSTADGVRSGDAYNYLREVAFDVPIEATQYGGTGMLFTGTVGSNSVLVTRWETYWSLDQTVLPTLSVDAKKLNFDVVRLGSSATHSLAVTGSNLLANIAITVPAGYSATPAAGWDNRKGGTLEVTFTPTPAGKNTGQLVISSFGAADRSVELYGKGK